MHVNTRVIYFHGQKKFKSEFCRKFSPICRNSVGNTSGGHASSSSLGILPNVPQGTNQAGCGAQMLLAQGEKN